MSNINQIRTCHNRIWIKNHALLTGHLNFLRSNTIHELARSTGYSNDNIQWEIELTNWKWNNWNCRRVSNVESSSSIDESSSSAEGDFLNRTVEGRTALDWALPIGFGSLSLLLTFWGESTCVAALVICRTIYLVVLMRDARWPIDGSNFISRPLRFICNVHKKVSNSSWNV